MKRGGKGKMARVVVIVAGVVLLGAAGFVGYPRLAAVLAGESAGAATYRVRSETYTDIIEIAGTVSAAKEQKLQAAGAGTVTAVYVREGDRVAKGQVVLRLDDSEQRYNLEKHDFDMAQKRVSGSPREIELLERQREVLEQRLKDRQVIANFDGVIAQFSIAVGDVVEAKDSAGVILDRSYLKATVEVVETDAPKLRPGQKVTLAFPALAAVGDAAGTAVGGTVGNAAKNTSIEGYVYSFPAVAAKSSRGASVVNAEIRIDDPPDAVLPNYSFTGSIEISPPETLLLVERLAIGYGPPASPEGAPLGGGLTGDNPLSGGENAPSSPKPVSGRGQPPVQGSPRPSASTAGGPEGASLGGGLTGDNGGPLSGGENAPASPQGTSLEGGATGRAAGTAQGENVPEGGRRVMTGTGAGFAEKILPGGGVERVAVRVEPYGNEFVKVLSGLAEGDEVKAQGTAPRSGQNRQSGAAANTGSGQQNRQGSGPPMLPPGGGPARVYIGPGGGG